MSGFRNDISFISLDTFRDIEIHFTFTATGTIRKVMCIITKIVGINVLKRISN